MNKGTPEYDIAQLEAQLADLRGERDDWKETSERADKARFEVEAERDTVQQQRDEEHRHARQWAQLAGEHHRELTALRSRGQALVQQLKNLMSEGVEAGELPENVGVVAISALRACADVLADALLLRGSVGPPGR